MGIREDIEKVQEKVEKMEEQSFAMSILNDYKKQNKRQFIVILILIIGWFLTGAYLVYLLNDIGAYEETTQEVHDVETIGGNVINKGDINGDN